MTEQLHFHFSLSCIGERNGGPLQYSCLENSMDRVAWWGDILLVIYSQTIEAGGLLSEGGICFHDLNLPDLRTVYLCVLVT